MTIENVINDLFGEESDKKWMQKEGKEEDKKGTTGSLRAYFKVKDEDAITMDMIDKELDKLKSKYIKKEGDKYPINILAIIRKLNMAKIYLKAGEKKKKKSDKSTEEDMELFISEESLNYLETELDDVKAVLSNYFED
jgi:hypothetical protein